MYVVPLCEKYTLWLDDMVYTYFDVTHFEEFFSEE